jgi:hypothetical protein
LQGWHVDIVEAKSLALQSFPSMKSNFTGLAEQTISGPPIRLLREAWVITLG